MERRDFDKALEFLRSLGADDYGANAVGHEPTRKEPPRISKQERLFAKLGNNNIVIIAPQQSGVKPRKE